MIPKAVDDLILRPSEDAVEAALLDKNVFFWVDWREDDDQIPGMCEEVLKTGNLKCEWDDDERLVIVRGSQREIVPLATSQSMVEWILFFGWLLPDFVTDQLTWQLRGNRHLTLVALNKVLSPDYEIRLVNHSCDGDEAAFLPLSRADWSALAGTHGALESTFTPIVEGLNLFTDPATPAGYHL